jgi:hypothetical protein
MEHWQDSRGYKTTLGILFALLGVAVFTGALEKGLSFALLVTLGFLSSVVLLCLFVTTAWAIVLVPGINLLAKWSSGLEDTEQETEADGGKPSAA